MSDVPEPQPQRTPDMDKMMLAGCSSFIAAAFLTYFLWVWPFFVVSDLYRFTQLQKNFALGAGASLLPIIFFAKKAGLAGLCGCLAGTMAFGVFFFLRVDQFFWGAKIEQIPQPDYSLAVKWVFPLIGVIFAATVGGFFMPKDRP